MKSQLWKFKRTYFIKHIRTTASIQKIVWSKEQPPGVFCKKKVFLGLPEISREISRPLLGSLFNEAAGYRAWIFIEERLWRRGFPERFVKLLLKIEFILLVYLKFKVTHENPIIFAFFWFCIIIDDDITGWSYHLFKQATLIPWSL